MPVKVHTVDNGLGIIILATGVVEDQEFYSAYMEHLSRPEEEFAKILYTFSDYSAATKIHVGLSSLTKVAKKSVEASKKINKDIVIITVVADSIAYGLAKIFSGLAKLSGWNIVIYREKAEAEQYLRKKVKEKFGDNDLKFKL